MAELCRLCSSTIPHTKNHLPYDKSRFSRDIKLALKVDIEQDTTSHPQYICESCRMKLRRWRKNFNNRKVSLKPININVNYQISNTAEINWEQIQQHAVNLGFTLCNDSSRRYFMKINDGEVQFSLQFENNGEHTLKVLGHVVNDQSLYSFPLTSTKHITNGLAILGSKKLCMGNDDFEDICRNRNAENLATFVNAEGEISALEELYKNRKLVRTVNCLRLCAASEDRCNVCQMYRTFLYMCRTRLRSAMSKPKLTHRLDYMNPNMLRERCLNSRDEIRGLKRRINVLVEQIHTDCTTNGIELEDGLSSSFVKIMQDNKNAALQNFQEGSIQHLLWQQQLEAATRIDSRQMRWHPILLRWCIALHAKSPSAYKMMKNSKILTLPCENTLRDYTKFTDAGSGWNSDVIERIILDHEVDENALKSEVSLLFDEVKIKSGLVYCTETGKLIGFCDLGTVNNELYAYNAKEKRVPELATHILAIMIRGIFSRIECVVAHYPCKGFSSDQLFVSIWEGVGLLEGYGFKVRALICDGATPNRKFYRYHGNGQDICHRTVNPFNRKRNLYFICDTPHLLKTTRNNFENSGWNNKTRNLHFNGLPIKWSQIVRLVEDDIHGMGLRLLPKLTYEHIHLTPTLRMRVKLAVQVLSSSVAAAFQLQNRAETKSTETFIRMFDQFFDCLNVNNITNGTYHRKPVLCTYTDVNDWRFKWLIDDFLGFLERWEMEGQLHNNLTAKEKNSSALVEKHWKDCVLQ